MKTQLTFLSTCLLSTPAFAHHAGVHGMSHFVGYGLFLLALSGVGLLLTRPRRLKNSLRRRQR